MNFSVNSVKVQGLKSEICLTPFSRLFLHIAECTSGKSVSSNLILPLLDFFHFLIVFTFLCGQSTCACGGICQDLLSGWLGQLHPDECAGSAGRSAQACSAAQAAQGQIAVQTED